MSNIRYGDGTKERYTYDTFDQLTQIQNDQGITQTYGYDPEGDRIYTKVEKDDPLDQKEWYNNLRSEDTASDIRKVEDKSAESFDAFKEKLSKADDYLCTFTKDYFEIEWSESEAEYVVDKTAEHTEVLWIEDEGNQIYGESERLRSEGADVTTEYINGLNNSVYESITTTPWTTSQTVYSYDDYGNTEDVVQGYGYNGERRDQSGLIYLRARYYNPKIGRFIQIDSYRGEKEQPDTQNRYIYTLNNPYKYTDPSGHISTLIGGLGALGDLLAALAAAASAIGAAFSWASASILVGGIGLSVAIGMGIGWLLSKMQATPGVLPSYQGSDGTTYGELPYGGTGRYIPIPRIKCIPKVKEDTDARAEPIAIPNTDTNTDDDDDKKTGPYWKAHGHRIHQAAAFNGSSNYSYYSAWCISIKYMLEKGIDHQLITNSQRRQYGELDRMNSANKSISKHSEIALNSLLDGKADPAFASALVAESLSVLLTMGVSEAFKIPWSGEIIC